MTIGALQQNSLTSKMPVANVAAFPLPRKHGKWATQGAFVMSESTKTVGSQVQQGVDAMGDTTRRMFQEQMGRAGEMLGEAGRVEARGMAQARENIDEAARLTKETLAYWGRLSTAWRSIALDSMAKSAELFGATAKAGEAERAKS